MQTIRARQLRRDMTDAECRLWLLLRNRRLAGCKFRRQHPIGPYIADFACLARRLIVEADGRQHGGLRLASDRHRDAWLQEEGWRVVRFTNEDILRHQADVLEEILRIIETSVA
ncbi:MAG TPA: DUF559 domain-containing protein [Acetobacteraceae bacterium]|jgi:very-short-patch-repair endonuclease